MPSFVSTLIVIVVVLAFVLSRKRWVMRQLGAFRGAIRVARGEIVGLGPKWIRGYGRRVRDVLVWTKAPLLLRNEILATDGLDEQRPARPDEVKRLGDHPVVVRVRMEAQRPRSRHATTTASWSSARTSSLLRRRLRLSLLPARRR